MPGLQLHALTTPSESRSHRQNTSGELSCQNDLVSHLSGDDTPGKPQRSHEYYFEDGNIVIQVENTLFRLHRTLLQKHSPVFRELFAVPQPAGSTEGLSDETPIVLFGIQSANFTRLLWLLYPPVLASCTVASVDEWMTIFETADLWQIEGLREHSLKQLRSQYIEPGRKIVFWNRYDLPLEELIPSFMELIGRSKSISLREAQEVGLETFVKIAHARDMAHNEGVSGRGGYSVKTDRVLCDIIQRVFGLPVPGSIATPVTSSL